MGPNRYSAYRTAYQGKWLLNDCFYACKAAVMIKVGLGLESGVWLGLVFVLFYGRFLVSEWHILSILQPLPLHYFDQRRVYIIDQVDYGVHDRLHIYTCV